MVGPLIDAAPESFPPLTLLRLAHPDALLPLSAQDVHILLAAPLPPGWRSRLIDLGRPFSILHEPALQRAEAVRQLLQALAEVAGRPSGSTPTSTDFDLDSHVCGRCGHPHYERLGRAATGAPGTPTLSLRRPELLRLIDPAG
jgi:hypothetical protein